MLISLFVWESSWWCVCSQLCIHPTFVITMWQTSASQVRMRQGHPAGRRHSSLQTQAGRAVPWAKTRALGAPRRGSRRESLGQPAECMPRESRRSRQKGQKLGWSTGYRLVRETGKQRGPHTEYCAGGILCWGGQQTGGGHSPWAEDNKGG